MNFRLNYCIDRNRLYNQIIMCQTEVQPARRVVMTEANKAGGRLR